jgi:hypothetical protein
MAYKHSALETIFTALSTELNSLANATACSASSAFDNDSVGQRWTAAMVEIYIATQGTARSAGASVSLYIIPTTDGTNYGDTTDECLDNYSVGHYGLDDTTTARYITGRIHLPPTDYKVVLKNNTGQAFAASGNTVKLREFTSEDV